MNPREQLQTHSDQKGLLREFQVFLLSAWNMLVTPFSAALPEPDRSSPLRASSFKDSSRIAPFVAQIYASEVSQACFSDIRLVQEEETTSSLRLLTLNDLSRLICLLPWSRLFHLSKGEYRLYHGRDYRPKEKDQ